MPNENTQRASNFVPETIIAGGLVDRIGKGLNQIQAGFGFEFFNSLNTTVIVMMRTGVKYHIPPMGTASFKGLLIRTNYGVVGGVNVDTHDLLNDTGRMTSREAELIEKVVARDDSKYNSGRYPHTGIVDYVITQSEFEALGGTLYLENLDLTLSVRPIEMAPSHPYSLAGMRKSLVESSEALMENKGMTYEIRIIDRLGRFGDRFVNLAGEVFHVKAERNSDLLDGVYAVSNYPAMGDQSTPLPRSQYLSFDVADKELHLYHTFNDAKTLGNPQDVYKRELEEKAHSLKLKEADWASEKASWTREADERKREIDRVSHEAKMRLIEREDQVRDREQNVVRQEQENRLMTERVKRDALILKESYDNRSLDRKEVIEIAKHLPALIGGVAAIYMAIKKLKG